MRAACLLFLCTSIYTTLADDGAPARFTRGPFIQNTSSNSIQIIWRTSWAANTVVEWGTNPALGSRFNDLDLVTNHVVTLTNLTPDTLHYYRVRSSAGGQTALAPLESFRTFRTSGAFSFAVFGDSGAGTPAQYAIADVLRNAQPDLVLHAGDVIYPSFTSDLVDSLCLNVYQAHMKSTPYFFAFGNHDLYNGDTHFLEAFYLPTNTVSGTEHYYSFDHGDAHFAVLFIPYLSQSDLKVGDAQHRWLVADLAASNKPWKFLLFHNPIFSSGPHRLDDSNANGIPDRIDIGNVILPIASRYGVQLIFAGHDHIYERFAPTNGVHSIVTGGGGVGLYGMAGMETGSAQFWSRHHCVKVTVSGDTLLLQALDETGAVFDSMTLCRKLPPVPLYYAGWHSPIVESRPADDADGNITGQRFDFVGTPIPTLAGQFSNLGQGYVNNDRTHLYLGIEQSMIRPDNNIFLFIETPRQTGITNLLYVGNGLVDPGGEGADGLDFLDNLSFTNFAPSIGCILGDEFADAQARSFARPGLALNVGQGAFRLDAKISDVPGVRVQQFNRSPQTEGISGEQDANFIELAIPYEAMGNLQPGDIIKIGAVVGGSEFDTNRVRPSRQLDSSFLGRSLSGGGLAPLVLEGLRVQLAVDPGSGAEFRMRIESVGDQRYRISWPAEVGKKYQVQVAGQPVNGFVDLAGAGFPLTATSTNLSYIEDLRLASPSMRFYRVRVVP
jgi:3',5'-cyclic AMP phosphodiesterase CpdA